MFWISAHGEEICSPCATQRTHGKHFINLNWNSSFPEITTLPCALDFWHTANLFFLTNLFSNHVSLNLMECKLKIITKLTKHIIWSASLKILYFFMHVYVNLNITTSIIIVLKNLKNGQKIQKIVVIQHKLLLCGVLPIGKV